MDDRVSDLIENRLAPLVVAVPLAFMTYQTAWWGFDGGYQFFTLTPACALLAVVFLRWAVRGKP